ncbi:hypothetical protein RRG08_033081 [Elysia crispata]|uniref:Uncharacterized protein n=1 Tax=Elysia crispata TaxID=231223 RepID=A0AAE1A7L4_9GAST|nr:hypothetical protein RRG08_033081 [Elysia crispata]
MNKQLPANQQILPILYALQGVEEDPGLGWCITVLYGLYSALMMVRRKCWSMFCVLHTDEKSLDERVS